jgi:hypothetical protein
MMNEPHRVPTQLLATWENPGGPGRNFSATRGIRLFAESMEEGLAAAANGRGNAGRCVWMSIAVHRRLLDKRWTPKRMNAVSI